MTAPGYIGAGVMGAPAAEWHDLLLRHPEVRGPAGRRRELRFFTEFCRREMREGDVARYHRRFRPRPGQIAGEWSPGYIHEPWTPPLIARAAPDAKVLVLLRDPFAQYRTRLAEARGALGPDEAHHFVVDAIARLRHGSQLRALREAVAPERILVLQHERCERDPEGEYRRTLRFLGVDDAVPLPRARRPRRRRRVEPAPLWPAIEETLHAELDPEVRALQAMVPELDLELWPEFAGLRAQPAP